MFTIGTHYSKNDIYDTLNVPDEKQGGHWHKGHASFNNIHFIFANIDISGSGYGKEGEYDYNNRIDKIGNLDWVTEDNRSQEVPIMKQLIKDDSPLIFIREKNTPKNMWKFYGLGSAIEINGNNPVRIKWKIDQLDSIKLDKKFRSGNNWGHINPNIFIFTAGDKNARKHLDDSISKSINIELIKKHLSTDLISKINNGNDNFYAWGAVYGPKNVNNWNGINEGDYMLTVYDSTYQYVSRVLSKTQNKSLAEEIWGNDDSGNTWEYMYFLSEPKKIEVQLSLLSNYLNKRYLGFTKISKNKIFDIIGNYNDLNSFFDSNFSFREEKILSDLSELNVPLTKEGNREVSIRTNAAITGNKAEEIFIDIYNNSDLFPNAIEIKDETDLHGKGYDFTVINEDKSKIYIEIKGCKDNLQGVRMTENEWNVAKKNGDNYYLVIIYNISTNPSYKKIKNPTKNLIASEKATVSITYHINKSELD
jgi:hypothetical protein